MGHSITSHPEPETEVEEIESDSRWMYTARVPTKHEKDKISKMSRGFRAINDNTIVKSCEENNITDGARWSRGFTKGKHVFEIGFPSTMRGQRASVGVGTKRAEISANGQATLIGSTEDSWGIDLKTCEAVHNGAKVRKFPKGLQKVMPDRFYMYIDMESRSLLFGADECYYGAAFTDMGPEGVELFPMAAASKPGATISMVYRGKGKSVEGPLRKRR